VEVSGAPQAHQVIKKKKKNREGLLTTPHQPKRGREEESRYRKINSKDLKNREMR
jgi:hypothetical protein